jgi:hypothetical protein
MVETLAGKISHALEPLNTNPVQIVVAAAALLAAFLLGYAVRRYVSHRRGLRSVRATLLFFPENRRTTTDTKPDAVDIHHGLVTILVYAAVIGWMWFHYPACEQEHVAVFAPQSASMWACAQGTCLLWGLRRQPLLPPPRSISSKLTHLREVIAGRAFVSSIAHSPWQITYLPFCLSRI